MLLLAIRTAVVNLSTTPTRLQIVVVVTRRVTTHFLPTNVVFRSFWNRIVRQSINVLISCIIPRIVENLFVASGELVALFPLVQKVLHATFQ